MDSQGVCVSYQETYQCIMVSGMRCLGLERANDNRKGYFCHYFFLVRYDSAKMFKSVNPIQTKVWWNHPVVLWLCVRGEQVWWARLHQACWFLVWSCRVLAECPHETSQRGLLPCLRPRGFVQIQTSSPEKMQGDE